MLQQNEISIWNCWHYELKTGHRWISFFVKQHMLTYCNAKPTHFRYNSKRTLFNRYVHFFDCFLPWPTSWHAIYLEAVNQLTAFMFIGIFFTALLVLYRQKTRKLFGMFCSGWLPQSCLKGNSKLYQFITSYSKWAAMLTCCYIFLIGF